MAPWRLELKGGTYHGWQFVLLDGTEPQPTLIAWACGPICGGHAAFDATSPYIVLRNAVAYQRTEVDVDAHWATYEVGENTPFVEEEARELVGAGSGRAVNALLWTGLVALSVAPWALAIGAVA